jgi:ribulose-5-phosphate 4-epimerase/fuculose-1-phosphate aldolase
MQYAIKYNGTDPVRDRILERLVPELAIHEVEQVGLEDELNFILNLTSFCNPQTVVRKARDEFVVSLLALHDDVDNLKYHCYNALIKTLSNLLVCIRPNGKGEPEVYCITPETGFYHFPFSASRLYESMLPVIGSKMVINNRITTNLPAGFVQTKATEQLIKFGGVLDALGVLPAPFPLAEVLDREALEHLYQLFKVKGLSYGNLSTREHIPGFRPGTFWMTARGVDKAHLNGVGKDVLLVTGYDLHQREVLVSLPRGCNPKIRVSVDAIEHALIYETFNEVGAIVHVHAWMKDIPYTQQNYPCGTIELAREVVALLKTTENPGRTVVGLKNHGLTITGKDLDDVFTRIEGQLIKEIPMMP